MKMHVIEGGRTPGTANRSRDLQLRDRDAFAAKVHTRFAPLLTGWTEEQRQTFCATLVRELLQ